MRAFRLLLLATLIVTTAPVEAAPPATLAGTNVVRATRPVAVDVRLPRGTVLHTPRNGAPELSVDSTGRFTGVALVGTGPRTNGVVVAGGAFADPHGNAPFLAPVHPLWGASGYETGKTYGDEVELPAGAYRLYVVPGGAPATVTLRVPGLTGTASLAARATAATLAFPPPRTDGPEHNAYAAGSTVRVASRSLLFHGFWMDTAAHAAAQVMLCQGPPSGQAVTVEPACLAYGQGESLDTDRGPTPARDAKLHFHAFGPMPAGDYEMSVWYVTASLVDDVTYVTLEVPLQH